jgi:hypothetical protein
VCGTVTFAVYGGVKILMELSEGNMWCTVMKNNVIIPFFLEELTVTGEKFLPMMEGTALHHIPGRTFFHLDGAPPHFPLCFHAFLDREFPDCWIGGGVKFPCPSVFQAFSYISFLLGVCKRHCLSRKGAKYD